MNDIYVYDKKRNREGYVLRFLFVLRGLQRSNNLLLKIFYKALFFHYRKKYGLEIAYSASIGKGLYLGHAFNITVNRLAKIGENCNLHKGVVIGRENRGKRKGAPIIGNCVWVGANAVIVGNIIIGDDVLIAPNSFVNCDVPSHSVVFGNPCVIKHRENATENYINNKV